MKKLQSTLPNIFLSLTGICLVAGLALSAANKYTETAIAASKAAELQNAVRQVTPAFDNNPTAEKYLVAVAEGDSLTVYPAKKGEMLVGGAVESYSKKGFSGIIRIMVGFDNEGKVLNYTVLEHSETPGLGSKMDSWFRTEKNQQNIIGQSMKQGAMQLVKDGGSIDAITAATISSRAFIEAINLAYTAYSANDATTGATTTDSTTGATTTDEKESPQN